MDLKQNFLGFSNKQWIYNWSTPSTCFYYT